MFFFNKSSVNASAESEFKIQESVFALLTVQMMLYRTLQLLEQQNFGFVVKFPDVLIETLSYTCLSARESL